MSWGEAERKREWTQRPQGQLPAPGLPHTSHLRGVSPLKKVGNLGGLLPLRLVFGCLYWRCACVYPGIQPFHSTACTQQECFCIFPESWATKNVHRSSTIHSSSNWKLPKYPSAVEEISKSIKKVANDGIFQNTIGYKKNRHSSFHHPDLTKANILPYLPFKNSFFFFF